MLPPVERCSRCQRQRVVFEYGSHSNESSAIRRALQESPSTPTTLRYCHDCGDLCGLNLEHIDLRPDSSYSSSLHSFGSPLSPIDASTTDSISPSLTSSCAPSANRTTRSIDQHQPTRPVKICVAGAHDATDLLQGAIRSTPGLVETRSLRQSDVQWVTSKAPIDFEELRQLRQMQWRSQLPGLKQATRAFGRCNARSMAVHGGRQWTYDCKALHRERWKRLVLRLSQGKIELQVASRLQLFVLLAWNELDQLNCFLSLEGLSRQVLGGPQCQC